MSDTVTQLVIEDMATENVLLRERIGSLESDVAVYREMAQVALGTIVQLTARLEQARRRLALSQFREPVERVFDPGPHHQRRRESEVVTVQ